jgi:hypothetical protein
MKKCIFIFTMLLLIGVVFAGEKEDLKTQGLIVYERVRQTAYQMNCLKQSYAQDISILQAISARLAEIEQAEKKSEAKK